MGAVESRIAGLERTLQRLRDDLDISAAILRRVDHGQDAFREDMRTRRVDSLEREPRD